MARGLLLRRLYSLEGLIGRSLVVCESGCLRMLLVSIDRETSGRGGLRNKSFVVRINPIITVTNNQARCDNPSHQHHTSLRNKETIPNRY
jgi:hypothetical protein